MKQEQNIYKDRDYRTHWKGKRYYEEIVSNVVVKLHLQDLNGQSYL